MQSTQFDELATEKKQISPGTLDEFFSILPALEIEDLFGKWEGGYFKTGSIYDRFLAKLPILHWYGKVFHDENQVNALVMSFLNRHFSLPYFGSAVIRKMEYREKNSVSMIYNYLPIIDHFRMVDRDTMMGVMTLKGRTEVYFYLKKCDGKTMLH